MQLGYSTMNNLHHYRPDDLARALEERGFDSLWIGEHAHIPAHGKTPYPAGGELPEPYKHMADPFVSLTLAAAVTKKLKLALFGALLGVAIVSIGGALWLRPKAQTQGPMFSRVPPT